MSDERYVITADIRSAVDGHEESVLSHLGIQPNKGLNDHVDCPYPEHGGKADWRWDRNKARAYCTCSTGDSVFDVAMKCRSLDFEEAKIFVAEAIGETALIKTKGDGKDAERDPDNAYQGTSAARLLVIKERFRDDNLPARYLGARLGLADVDVLMPTTPVRGITHHHHFHGKDRHNKPKSVAVTPCAVFVQIDAERRKHAHRIFLSPDGRDKASLPHDMPAKKSAKAEKDENTSGRCVIWGLPTKAPHLIVCEGIETAAAVAQTFRGEIETNEVCVASAISANGVEALQPWPATKRITIGADRDEAEKNGRPASQRGETAARKLGVRLMETDIRVAIAMPGTAGQALDWLDVYLTEGIEAVRAGILGAEPFKASPEEIAEHRQNADREAEIALAYQTYPLPQLASKVLVYAHDQNDRIRVHKVTIEKHPLTKQDMQVLHPLMTPMGVVARLRNVDQDDAYSLRIVVEDMNRRPRNIDVLRSALAKMNGSEIKALLLERGLRVEEEGEQIAVQLLKVADPDAEIVIVQQPSWHTIDGADEPFFVTAGGTVLNGPADRQIELEASTRLAPAIVAGGTLAGWKIAVAAALSQVDCPHWALGVMSAFAGSIIGLTGMDTCGINLSGRSSSGKTTAQKLAVSAWTVPDTTKPGLARSARATANSIEKLCQEANGAVLSLDELAHVSGKELGKVIYTIAGGVGKTRLKSDASLRDSHRWLTFAILSAEQSLRDKVEADGETFMAGMAARIPDIDVSGVDRNVDKAVMATIETVSQNFGHAGPAFVQSLIADGWHMRAGELRDNIGKYALLLAGEGADSAVIRAALPFAILRTAGKQAQRAGLLPADFDVGHSIGWAWGRFGMSKEAVALDPKEEAFARLRLWIIERWNVSIRDIGISAGGNQPAVAWYDEDAVFIPRERLREAAGGGLKEAEIAASLDEAGHLHRREDARRPYVRYVRGLGKGDFYALSRRAFGKASAFQDGDRFSTVDGDRA